MSIKEVVDEINTVYFLPHIQRSMVWDEDQIYRLFDSLLRGYPINTFLFWKVKKSFEIDKLKFIDIFTKNKTNEISLDNSKDHYYLVLDGQQRLQSFLIGLKGSYNGKELFLNVLSDDKVIYDETELIFETEFKKSKESVIYQEDQLWVKIKDFALLSEDKLFDFIIDLKESYEDKLLGSKLNLLEKNINKLNRLCQKDDIVNYYLEKEENSDKILDIFIRTNSGGTKLSKADLLFSIIKLKWTNEDAFAEFNNLIKNINNDSFNFNHDFILKTALVLIDEDVKYKVDNFNKTNILKIEKNWPKIKDSIISSIELIKQLRFNSKRILTSNNAIIPIIYYTYINNIKTYDSYDKKIVLSKKNINIWLSSVLLTNIFSSQTDTLLTRFRTVINENKELEFPMRKLNEVLPSGKLFSIKFDDFSKIKYGDKKYFVLLNLLYPDINFNPQNRYSKLHVDHIFAVDLLKSKYSSELINNIGNLELLSASENESKSNSSLEEWIKSKDESFYKVNHMPLDKNLYSLDNYKLFLEERLKMLYEYIKENYNFE